jgi:hypothetical protein
MCYDIQKYKTASMGNTCLCVCVQRVRVHRLKDLTAIVAEPAPELRATSTPGHPPVTRK